MAARWSATGVVQRAVALAGAAGAAVVLGLVAQPAAAVAEPAVLGQWRFDERAGQVAVDDGPHRLNGRLGLTDAPDAADPVRIGGASGRALAFDGNASVSLPAADALAVQRLSAETVVRASASPGQFRYLISRGSHGCLAGSYGLYTGRRRRDRAVCLRWDALRRVGHRVAGRHLERRLAPRCRHVRWPRAAPVPRWPTGRRADGRAAAYRLRPDVRAHRLRPVRRRLRTQLPRRHGPRAAVVRTPVAGGRRQGRRRLLGTARRRTATRRRSGKGDPGRLDDAGQPDDLPAAGAGLRLATPARLHPVEATHRDPRARDRPPPTATGHARRRSPSGSHEGARQGTDQRNGTGALGAQNTAIPTRADQHTRPQEMRVRPPTTAPPIAPTCCDQAEDDRERRLIADEGLASEGVRGAAAAEVEAVAVVPIATRGRHPRQRGLVTR